MTICFWLALLAASHLDTHSEFQRELNAVDAAHIDRGIQAAAIVRLAHPSLARQLLDRSMQVSPYPRQTETQYFLAISDWEQAIHSARAAKDAGFVHPPSTEQLLLRLQAERPPLAADLFRELLAALPATLTTESDLFFVARRMTALANDDPALAATAAERILGSVEPTTFQPAALRSKLLFIAGAYLAKLDPDRYAWRTELLAPWREAIKSARLPDVAKSVPPFVPGPWTPVDLSPLRQALRDELEQAFPLDQHRGQWLLVNFWEPWCAPCKRERPLLERFAQQHPDIGITFVSGKQALLDQFEISELPLTFLFDRQGGLVDRLTGEQTAASLQRAIEAIMNREQP